MSAIYKYAGKWLQNLNDVEANGERGYCFGGFSRRRHVSDTFDKVLLFIYTRGGFISFPVENPALFLLV